MVEHLKKIRALNLKRKVIKANVREFRPWLMVVKFKILIRTKPCTDGSNRELTVWFQIEWLSTR